VECGLESQKGTGLCFLNFIETIKDKFMYYWTVLNDLSDKHEKLRKDITEIIQLQ
jgi:hypothetical protein